MQARVHIGPVADVIRALARKALPALQAGSVEARHATMRARRPVDYMRCAEFQAVLGMANLAPGMRVLDISSPEWFSLYLAATHPDTQFLYTNILEPTTRRYRNIAAACGLTNLAHQTEDARQLTFAAGQFDRVFSLSVIEHISPAEGGDVAALKEIRRVLKPDGLFLLTMPFKRQRNVVYQQGPVFERAGTGLNFFAREYDQAQFDALVHDTGFRVARALYLAERPGPLALDALEWGSGRGRWHSRARLRLLRALERLRGDSCEPALAAHYLRILETPAPRLVNIAAALVP